MGRYPLFTFNEFIRVSNLQPNYARLYLFRLKKEGLIFQVEKGKYTLFEDPMVFASFIQIPSYISFWTAIRFYNLTEQLPLDIMVATTKSKKPIIFQNVKIRFFKTKHLWGYRKTNYGDVNIFMAEKEKSIIDSLLLKNTPFDEILKALETKEINFQKLIDYAVKTKNISLIKRVGYLCDHFGFNTKKLLLNLDKNYILLDPLMGKEGQINKKWKLIQNRSLYDSSG